MWREGGTRKISLVANGRCRAGWEKNDTKHKLCGGGAVDHGGWGAVLDGPKLGNIEFGGQHERVFPPENISGAVVLPMLKDKGARSR